MRRFDNETSHASHLYITEPQLRDYRETGTSILYFGR
jgi:hypothetical protein